MKKRLTLLALPAVLTVSLATPAHAHAVGDDGVQAADIEQPYVGTSPGITTVMDYVYAQLGKPYVFGAAGPDAFDCSGLTLAAYRQVGIALPHGSIAQSHMGWRVNRDDVQAGDLIFMRGGSPAVDRGHVGIAVSATEMISAPHAGASVHRVGIPNGVQAIRRYVVARPEPEKPTAAPRPVLAVPPAHVGHVGQAVPIARDAQLNVAARAGAHRALVRVRRRAPVRLSVSSMSAKAV
jgi:hypothetical protein